MFIEVAPVAFIRTPPLNWGLAGVVMSVAVIVMVGVWPMIV
jgi:hypothetical protein